MGCRFRDGVGFTVGLGVRMVVGHRVGFLEGVRIGNLDGDFVDFLGATPGVGDGEPIGTDVGFGERFIDIEPPVIGGRLAFPPLPDAFP